MTGFGDLKLYFSLQILVVTRFKQFQFHANKIELSMLFL